MQAKQKVSSTNALQHQNRHNTWVLAMKVLFNKHYSSTPYDKLFTDFRQGSVFGNDMKPKTVHTTEKSSTAEYA